MPLSTRVFLNVSGNSRGLVDTNIIIHLTKLDRTELPEELVMTAISLAELSAGPHFSPDPLARARRANLAQYAESIFEALPFDADAARAFGVISAGVLAYGRSPRSRIADLMIAAVALANNLPLYTTNPKDFLGLQGIIQVEAVRRPA